jgi:hypothetical protein
VVDRLGLLTPLLQSSYREGVAQVVDARELVVAASLPAQTRLHAQEHILDRPLE